MALGDLQNLVGGSQFSTSSNQTSQTIVVTNGNQPVGSSCIPCNEGTVCEVAPTQGVNLDLSRFSAKDQVVRLVVDTRSSTDGGLADRNLIFMSDLRWSDWPEFNRLPVEFPEILVGGNSVHNGDTINGDEAGNFMQEFNAVSIVGGAAVGSMTIQYNGDTFPQNDGITIDFAFVPPDPSDSIIVHQELTPLCDFCTSNNNGANVTHKYIANGPISNRNLIVVGIPGATDGTLFTLDLCFVSNGLPNHLQDTWEHQARSC